MGLQAPPTVGVHSTDKKVAPTFAARIQQDTFDEAVRENMEDLDMDEAEAVQDAIAQFEAQGIDLSNVLKEAPSAERDAHPVVRGCAALDAAAKAGSEETMELQYGEGAAQSTMKLTFRALDPAQDVGDLVGDLNALRAACERSGDEGRAAQALLGAREGMDLLPSACLACLRRDELPAALWALRAALADAENRDRVGLRGLLALQACLVERRADAAVQAAAFHAAAAAMVGHEANRACLHEKCALVASAVAALKGHADDVNVVLAACAALRALTLQDDARKALNKGFDRARAAADLGALPLLNAQLAKLGTGGENGGASDAGATAALLLTLSRLAASNKICETLVSLGTLDRAVGLLRAHIADATVCRPACALLSALAGNDDVKQRLGEARAPELTAALLGGHLDAPAALDAAAQLLTALTTRHGSNCEAFVAGGGVEALVGAMRACPKHLALQKRCCLAVRNLAVRAEGATQALLEQGAEPLLREAMEASPELHDLAKAALRDMHCDVSLAQPWKGMPGESKTLEQGDADGENRFEQFMDTPEARAAMQAAGFDTTQM